MKVAEQPNDGIKSLLCFFICNTLKPSSKFFVCIFCNIAWCVWLGIHEVLEGCVSALLELHVVFETLLKHLIHLCFEFQQLSCKQDWVSQTLLVFHNLLASLFNIWNHLFDNQSQRLWISLKDLVHETKFIEFAMCEHIVTAS